MVSMCSSQQNNQEKFLDKITVVAVKLPQWCSCMPSQPLVLSGLLPVAGSDDNILYCQLKYINIEGRLRGTLSSSHLSQSAVFTASNSVSKDHTS